MDHSNKRQKRTDKVAGPKSIRATVKSMSWLFSKDAITRHKRWFFFWIVIFVCFAGLSLELKQEVPNTAPIVESLGFVMAQFFVGIPRPRIYTLNEINLEIFIFVTETEHGCIHGITSPRMSKKPTIHEIWPREFKWFHSIRSILSTNDSILHQMFQICFPN